jgi:hypothetical protein
MSKLSIKGILIGAITDVVATNIFLIPLVIYIVATGDLSGMPEAKMQSAIMAALADDGFIHSIQLVIGCACTVLGGYIGARIAKHDELLNAGLTSFLCMGGGIYSLISGAGDMPLWQHVSLLLFTPALAVLGGYLRLRTSGAVSA